MNFGNNIAMAGFSDHWKSVAAAGGQEITSAVPGTNGETLFWQMMSEMLSDSGMAEKAPRNGLLPMLFGETEQVEQPDALAEGLTGAEVWSEEFAEAGIAGKESAETEILSEETLGEKGMELQAWMAGLAGGAPPVIPENRFSALPETDFELRPQIAEAKPLPELAEKVSVKMELQAETAAQAGAIVQAEEKSDIRDEKASTTNGKLSESPEKIDGLSAFDRVQDAENELGQGEDKALKTALPDGNRNQEGEEKEISLEGLNFRNSVETANGAAAAKSVNPSAEAKEPYRQIGDEILAKLEQKGPTEFKMHLEPEDLGQIDIKLKLSEGKLMIDILAANAKTHTLLASQVDKLISGMGLQNVQVESVQVSQQMNAQSQDGNQSQGFTMHSAMDFSQGKQQEQLRQQASEDIGRNGFRQDALRSEASPEHIRAPQRDFHRMNYII